MRQWSINRLCALIIGIIFLFLGIIGFVTPPENSTGVQAILGIFDSDTFHNIFYLLTGLLGIISAFTGYFRTFNKIFSILYILLGVLALIPALYVPAHDYGNDHALFLGLTHMNAGDHILHLVTGIIAAIIGFLVVGDPAHPVIKATAHKRN